MTAYLLVSFRHHCSIGWNDILPIASRMHIELLTGTWIKACSPPIHASPFGLSNAVHSNDARLNDTFHLGYSRMQVLGDRGS